MFDVLPWSVAMPVVVKRLTCSIERMPSRTASRMSLAVTSFWKSTKALTMSSGPAPGAAAGHAAGPRAGRLALDRPGRRGAVRPACGPCGGLACRKRLANRRLQAVGPVARSDGGAVLGVGAGQEPSARLVPRQLAARLREQCTEGVQPADISSASTGITRAGLPPTGRTDIDDTLSAAAGCS